MPTLRAHCAERVDAGEAAQTVDMLLDLIEAMSERMTRLEQQVDRLLRERYARKSERISSAQLTLALDALERDRVGAREMGERARERVAARHSLAHMAHAYEALYASLVAARRLARARVRRGAPA